MHLMRVNLSGMRSQRRFLLQNRCLHFRQHGHRPSVIGSPTRAVLYPGDAVTIGGQVFVDFPYSSDLVS
jgi:hypothetical protein